MPLSTILADIASEGGYDINNSDQKKLTVYRINKAAKELYGQEDLIGSLFEQVMKVDLQEGNQVTMPNTLGRIRAVRYYYPQMNLGLVDMRARMQPLFWQAKGMLSWRVKREGPLVRDIANASILTISFKKPLTVACSVTIAGQTIDASFNSETLAFAIGDQTKTTTSSYSDIDNLSKSVPTGSDCGVFDVDGRMISLIPNNELQPLYTLVQVMNQPNGAMGNPSGIQPIADYVECLWKKKFRPFVNDADEFICPWYDDAIYWMYKKHEALRNPVAVEQGQTAPAVMYDSMVSKIMKDVAHDFEQNMDMYMNFGRNALLSAQSDDLMTSSGQLSGIPNWNGNPYVWP